MSLQIKALAELHQFFVSQNIPYVIIGGIALQYWGEPRFTRDIAVAGRAQDIADIESIILRQGNKLDVSYIRKWLQEFSNLLETNEVIDRFDKP